MVKDRKNDQKKFSFFSVKNILVVSWYFGGNVFVNFVHIHTNVSTALKKMEGFAGIDISISHLNFFYIK